MTGPSPANGRSRGIGSASGAPGCILRRPRDGAELPVLVTVPHFGKRALPDFCGSGWAKSEYWTLPSGFADAFAAELYGGLHRTGATVLATPYSRLFVDLNRRRDDYEQRPDGVRSTRGVVRTHMVRDQPIFARPLTEAEVEQRLASYYDPFYGHLRKLLDEMRARHGRALLLDAHTAIARRMDPHQIIIGTRRRETCHPSLAGSAESTFRAHGFAVAHDVPGYVGGNIVRTFGQSYAGDVHALQIEVNSTLLMESSRQAYIEQQKRGEVPRHDAAELARLRCCMGDLARSLAEALRELPT